MKIKTGIGYDIHPFAENRKCILGGVDIPFEMGLEGHSDADVLSHAIADAILGALGLPDIGYYFPPTDPTFQGLESLQILSKCRSLAEQHKATIQNIDSTLIAEAPKILSYIDEMKKKISLVLHLEPSDIGIKATTNEKIGCIGRGEGIAAMATTCIVIDSNPNAF